MAEKTTERRKTKAPPPKGKEGCLKKVAAHGLCAEHQKNKTAAPAETAAPPAPAAQA